jgi:fiber protein
MQWRDLWQRFLHDETGSVCITCGLEVVDGALGVKLDPAGGITCDADGLAVTFPASEAISPDDDNGLERRGNGLYAPCPSAVAGAVNQASINNDVLPLTIPTVAEATYDFSGSTITITNPHPCLVAGRIGIRGGGLYLTASTAFYGQCRLMVDVDGAGFAAANPDTAMVFENTSGGNLRTAFNTFVDDNLLTIAPGDSVTYNARLSVLVHNNGANSTLSGEVRFEYVWTLPQCCCPAL